jgi:class 3 adenylate cyclase
LSFQGGIFSISSNRDGARLSRRSPTSSPGEEADVTDDRVLATVLFTDIVDSTRRAAEMGDRDWRALLDAVVRAQLSRFRGREVSALGDSFLAMFDGPHRAIRCAMVRDAVRSLGIEVRAGLHTVNAKFGATTSVESSCTSAHA